MVYTALIALPTHMFWVRQEKTHLGGRAAKFEASKALTLAVEGSGAMVKSVKSPSSPL